MPDLLKCLLHRYEQLHPQNFKLVFFHVFSGLIFANGKANDNILTETQGEKGFLISIYVNLVLVIAVTDALQLKDYF